MLENYDDILTIEDLCSILVIGKNWVYRLLAEKKIAAFKIGRNWKIPKKAVINYISFQGNAYTRPKKSPGN